MPTTPTLDHLVFAANDLAAGRDWLERQVGCPLEPGGRHTDYGTHNLLLSLGPDAYLELIAPEPGTTPGRARWFELDTPAMRERLAAGPALVHWVARVESLAGVPEVRELTRGPNRWALTVPPDGSLPLGGVAPSLIQWHTPPPSVALPDRGIRLAELVLTTPEPVALEAQLGGIAPVRVMAGPTALRARLTTPHGSTEIGGSR
jgi:hypothetical protein